MIVTAIRSNRGAVSAAIPDLAVRRKAIRPLPTAEEEVLLTQQGSSGAAVSQGILEVHGEVFDGKNRQLSSHCHAVERLRVNLDRREVTSPGPDVAELGLLLIQSRQQVEQNPLPSLQNILLQQMIKRNEVEPFPKKLQNV
jgi:hypothetical protein